MIPRRIGSKTGVGSLFFVKIRLISAVLSRTIALLVALPTSPLMTPPSLLVRWSFVAGLFVVCSAQATPSEAEKDRAGALMDQGDTALEAGKNEAALEAYKQADAIMNVPTTRGAVAAALVRVGKLIEAREAALSIAKLPSPKNEPKPFKAARAAAQELAADLNGRIPSLRIQVRGPSGGDCLVELDGRRAPCKEAETAVPINPGSYRLVVRAEGFQEHAQSLVMAEREKRDVLVEMSRVPSKDKAPPVRSSSGASSLMYAGIVVGGAGIVLGSITGVMAFQKTKQLKDDCGGATCPPERQSDLDQVRSTSTLSNLSFAVGGVGLAVGLVSWLVSRPSAPPASTSSASFRVQPTLAPGSVGLTGQF